MKFILVSSALPYPPDSGSKLRNYYFLKSLSRMGDVYLVSLCQSLPAPESLRELRKYAKDVSFFPLKRSRRQQIEDVLGSLFGETPYLVRANTHAGVRRKVSELTKEETPTIVQVAELCMANNLPPLPSHARLVFDAHNVETSVQKQIGETAAWPWEKFFYRRQMIETRRFEERVAKRVDGLFAVSPEDQTHFFALNKRARCIPNGLELEQDAKEKRDDIILFTGTLQYPPNGDALRWFLKGMWPQILTDHPKIRLQVIARNPPESLRRLGNDRVEFLDEVDEIGPYLHRAKVMLVPLRAGGGTRFKVLQAFAHRLPVVSTSIGAEGISAVKDEHLLLADTPEEFARSVSRLLEEDDTAKTIASSAVELLREKYSWEKIFPHCAEMYAELFA